MTAWARRGEIAALLIALACSYGCQTYSRVTVDKELVPLRCAEELYPEDQLLDIRVIALDPGELPQSKNASRGLSKDIREIESHYIATELRSVLQKSGHWGNVRVVPDAASDDEVRLRGRIVKSDGEVLNVELEAIDATGRQWFKDDFKSAVDEKMYAEAEEQHREVFQNLYHRLANRLSDYRKKLSPDQVREIRQVAELRFANDLAPTIFNQYVIVDGKNQFVIDRLPAENDEYLARIRRVRDSNYMVVDALDAHCETMRQVEGKYTEWRKSRLQEMEIIRRVDDKRNAETAKGAALILGAIAIGAAASQANMNSYSNTGISATSGALAGAGVTLMLEAGKVGEQADINKAALEELGESFSTDLKPTVVKIENDVIELSGTAGQKYAQWRETLAKLYEMESASFASE